MQVRTLDSETVWNDLMVAIDGCGGDTLVGMLAYLDESGHHAQAEVITISGIVAPARAWKLLQKTRWAKAMRGFTMPYHHSDVLNEQKKLLEAGDTDGAKEYDELQIKLISTLSEIEYFGFGASLVRADWELYKSLLNKTEEYQNPWFHVFETAIAEIMHRTEDEFGITAPISFIFDRQDQFSKRALEIYNQALALDLPYRHRLGALSFVPKDRIRPLQAADLFTYESNRYVRDTLIKVMEPPRWQWEQICAGRPKRAINGRTWRKDTLEALVRERGIVR